jgi:flavin reductase (DIM6/NTAB) family NADH-FMN oxidoreductase RutF
MTKRQVPAFRPVYPGPAGLITSMAADGRANIITLGEVFNLSIAQPVIVGIAMAKQRHSHKLIMEGGEFVVNLPPASLVEKVDRCGTMSGRDVDKFAAVGLTAIPATRVRPPLIAECPVNLECRLLGVEEIGDHDLFRGEVLVQHVDADKLDDSGNILVERLDVLCYMMSQYWTVGRKLGEHGFTRRAKSR